MPDTEQSKTFTASPDLPGTPLVLDTWLPLGAPLCGPVVANEVTGTVPVVPNCTVVNVTGGALPAADWNVAYSHNLSATGGTAPYTWVLVSGALPDGVTLAADGTLSGTPTNFGDFSVSIKATDSVGNQCQRDFTLHVNLGADIWLKADDPNSIVGLSDGQNVDTWFDISGNGRDYTPFVATGAIPPIYRTNILIGKPGVDFGALAGCRNGAYSRGAGTAFTVFIVMQSYSNVNVGRRAINSGDLVNNWLVGPYTGSWRFFNGAFVTGPAIDLLPHYAYVTQTALGNGTFVFDGAVIGSNVGNPIGLTGLAHGGVMENFNGYIYELIWFGRVLTAPEIGYVTDYLKDQWGFP